MTTNSSKRRGFTMVELLVVIAMLMILAGAVTSSVGSATRRAKISQATADVQEMTNAILSYENYGNVGDENPLASKLMEDKEANRRNLGFILGEDGQKGKIPVLYNAEIKNDRILDPWGNAYRVTIRQSKIDPKEDSSDSGMQSYVAFPNFNRRPADEVKDLCPNP